MAKDKKNPKQASLMNFDASQAKARIRASKGFFQLSYGPFDPCWTSFPSSWLSPDLQDLAPPGSSWLETRLLLAPSRPGTGISLDLHQTSSRRALPSPLAPMGEEWGWPAERAAIVLGQALFKEGQEGFERIVPTLTPKEYNFQARGTLQKNQISKQRLM